MPKIVDHTKRKEEIAEAAWRVIRQEGLEGVSVRRVADEAGTSLGSLRYYFPSQDELLAFAMRLISLRVNERIAQLPFTGDPRRDMEMMLGELLPLNEQSRSEAEVWIAFAGKAASDPVIREASREVFEEMYAGVRQMLEQLVQLKLTKDGIDTHLETRRIHALLDGLVVHAVLFPAQFNETELKRTIAYAVESLLGSQS